MRVGGGNHHVFITAKSYRFERWAADTRDAKISASARRVAEHLRTHPDWGDDPAAFVPGVNDGR
jgi:hypothetical protein